MCREARDLSSSDPHLEDSCHTDELQSREPAMHGPAPWGERQLGQSGVWTLLFTDHKYSLVDTRVTLRGGLAPGP